MTNFPNQLDDDTTLLRIDDNITELGGEAINQIRSAIFAIEENIGLNANGSADSIADFLAVSFDGTGHIKPSALTGIGLVALPITDDEISPAAEIKESKLNLTYSTSSLFTLYTALKGSVDVLNGFLSLTGIKLEPHIEGTDYHHLLSAIDVDPTTQFVKILPLIGSFAPGTSVVNRNTTNADTLIKDISDDLVIHEKADGYSGVTAASGGTVPPEWYAHNASGIFIDTNVFSTIPGSNNDLQKFAEYVDNSSLLLLGSRVQNLYANGISRTSRSSSLLSDGYGEPIVSATPVTAYFLGVPPGPISSSPVDDFAAGDDVILFNPTAQQLSTFNFDAQFAQVRPGDLITIDYGTGITYQFVIDSTKAIVHGTNRVYAVRLNGKNIVSSTTAIARIDKSLFHRNKFGVLATAQSPNSIGAYESLIIANPRSAIALGNGFNPSELDANHYNLYLNILTDGTLNGLFSLPAIDITGNQGTTPGLYTLDSIIAATNAAFRAPGFNYRFIAFQYNGNFGIMLADPYNNTSFSITSGSVDANGNYTSSSVSAYPLNVIDNFNNIDPLGFGLNGANIASPPPAVSYSSVNAARISPTLFFFPLKRNFFYTNGVERDRLKSDPLIIDGIQDFFGDGYWPATITLVNILSTRVEITYQINFDISQSGIKNGKTIVVQPAVPISIPVDNFNFGRFTIKNISLNNCGESNAYANITVYDGVHGAGVSPAITFPVGKLVNIYFSDDSVSFNAENVFDENTTGPFKRFFEVYVDGNGHSFSHERARFLLAGSDISNINFNSISPKLRGYTTNNDKEIRLLLSDYTSTTGVFDGYMGRWNPSSSTITNLGPITTGRKGEVVRFYDETNIDYIDFIFNINDSILTWSTPKTIDIQLFSSLLLDQEMMAVATCQINDSTKSLSYLKDVRTFGNVSEEQLTNSALDLISANAKYLHSNAVIRGLNFVDLINNQLYFNGGLVLVNGNFLSINAFSTEIPNVQEIYLFHIYTQITWAICINKISEVQIIPLTDFNPSLDNPNAPTRLITLFNPATSTSYNVDCSTYINLTTNRQDLTILYTVVSTVS